MPFFRPIIVEAQCLSSLLTGLRTCAVLLGCQLSAVAQLGCAVVCRALRRPCRVVACGTSLCPNHTSLCASRQCANANDQRPNLDTKRVAGGGAGGDRGRLCVSTAAAASGRGSAACA